MSSFISIASVIHVRSKPALHRFRVPTFTVAVDLDELPDLSKRTGLFRHNRFGVFAVHDRDYLRGRTGSIRERLGQYLRERDIPDDFQTVRLVTTPRLLGYVFNPVNFYLCYDGSGQLAVLVAEVNNTFGETHIYALRPTRSTSRFVRFEHKKEFFVSPFFDVSGRYTFAVGRGEELDIRVNLLRGEPPELSFVSRISGTLRNLETKELLRAALMYPALAWLTFPRILVEAAKLSLLRKLPVIKKPAPSSRDTIGLAGPGFLERICMRATIRLLSQAKVGTLTLTLPDGSVRRFGEDDTVTANITIRDYAAFRRIVFSGDVGFGEAYTDGLWESEDVTAVLRFMAENYSAVDDRQIRISKLGRILNRLIHSRRRNTHANSRHNISAHYDLGNDFFREFLDSSMMYSCARFSRRNETLEEAQLEKIDNLIGKSKIAAGQRVLEIGCGWGAFAVRAAEQTGCEMTCITLSREQHDLTLERVAAAGLADRISVRLCDYRDLLSDPSLAGSFDRIVSIEMLEAVGDEHLGVFFRACDHLLKPDGLLTLQFISMPDQRYDYYAKNCDWIQKYIFPGGVCPSLTTVCNAVTAHSSFIVEHLENIGPDYARTLQEWRKRFNKNFDKLRKLGFDDRFARIWRYYLSYCEAGFSTRLLGTLQIVLTRPNNKNLNQT